MKCKEQHENHDYVKASETTSSFNPQAFDIITYKLANVFSFVEKVKETTKKKKQVFKVDMNKFTKCHVLF